MADRVPRGGRPDDAQERRLRRSWLTLVVAFGALALVGAVFFVVDRGPVAWIIVGLVAVVGIAGLVHRRVIADLEDARRLESESFQRILQGLSRSVSPDAIVDAIVEDLGFAAGADHTVVVRLRADARILEATLVSSRAGVPSSTTMLPLSDLEDPGPLPASTGRAPVAVAVEAGAASTALADAAGIARSGAIVASSSASAPASTGVGVFDDRPRIRDRPVRGLRDVSEAPLDDWETAAQEPPRRRSGGVAALRASVSGRAVDVDPQAGPAAASARISEQLARRVRSIYGLKTTLAQALVTEQGVVGAIVLSKRTGEPWTPAARRLLGAASVEASAALSRAYSHREAEARASTDALTGLPNRRYFDEFCGLLARRRRADDAVGVLMIDIDHFKRLNDEFGHPVGDQVLRAVAGAIAGAVREGDVPARFGGEEFAVLLRNPGHDVAMEVGERVRAAVDALDLSAFGPRGITVSVGVAVAHSADQPISDLVDEADHALYRAKRLGRDRVVAA